MTGVPRALAVCVTQPSPGSCPPLVPGLSELQAEGRPGRGRHLLSTYCVSGTVNDSLQEPLNVGGRSRQVSGPPWLMDIRDWNQPGGDVDPLESQQPSGTSDIQAEAGRGSGHCWLEGGVVIPGHCVQWRVKPMWFRNRQIPGGALGGGPQVLTLSRDPQSPCQVTRIDRG